MELLQRVQEFIHRHSLLRPKDTVILGVSGGPDSLCLLDVFDRLAVDWQLRLVVAHLNHGLRAEAEAEADFVRSQAEERGLAFVGHSADTLAYARRYKCSIEAAARQLRYDFLAHVALAEGASRIAVAHTADDQAETVLMHFLRGSGIKGMRGMLPKTVYRPLGTDKDESAAPLHLEIIRPLLPFSRGEIEAYDAERGLHPVQDASNRDLIYLRNRLRHCLLPQLEKYNPNLRSALVRMADVMAGEAEIVQRYIDKLWAQCVQVEGERVRLDRAYWLTLAEAEQRLLLREAVARLLPEREVDFTPVNKAVLFSRRAAVGRSCELVGGLVLKIGLKHLTVGRAVAEVDTNALPLLIDGRLADGWHFEKEILGPGEWSLADVVALPAAYWPPATEGGSREWQAYIDAALVHEPLEVRGRRAGDRFCPLGLGGHSVKISDYFITNHIEQHLRAGWPLVVCGAAIVWVAGLRLDERFKVTPATNTVMRLIFGRRRQP